MTNDIKKAIQKAKDDMRKKRKQAVKESVIMIEADAKLNAPVKTGTLKRGITHKVEHEKNITKGHVGSNVEYAYWAEQNQPYLEPALDSNIEAIKQKMAEVLEK